MKHKFVLITTIVGLAVCIGLMIMQMAQAGISIPDKWAIYPLQCEFRMYEFDLKEDVNNVTLDAPEIHGYLDGIVIDSNGTDTSFSVTLRDEHDCNIVVVSCTSASEPHRYAITIIDSNSVHGAATAAFLGAPVKGICDIVVADANDASLDDLHVYLYYRDYRRIP